MSRAFPAYVSPCVPVLATLIEATGEEYRAGVGVSAVTDRAKRCVDLQLHLPDGRVAIAHLDSLEQIDEVVSDLLAARADMVKLYGGNR